MSKDPNICRPSKLTCRWISEITQAINIVCQFPKDIVYYKNKSSNLGHYLRSLSNVDYTQGL